MNTHEGLCGTVGSGHCAATHCRLVPMRPHLHDHVHGALHAKCWKYNYNPLYYDLHGTLLVSAFNSIQFSHHDCAELLDLIQWVARIKTQNSIQISATQHK